MKRVKLVTLAGAILAVVLVAAGCGQTTPAKSSEPAATTQPADNGSKPADTKPAEKPDATQTSATEASKATYVGEQTCLQCHQKTKFDTTKHVQSFKPMSAYKFAEAPGEITVYDGSSKDEKSAKIDLSKSFGVQMDDYVVASVPGFTDKYSRVAKIEKVEGSDTYKLVPATHSPEDVNKDGTPDFVAENYSCGTCHSPVMNDDGSVAEGVTCEACHGPGSIHVSATSKEDRIKAMTPLPDGSTCLKCHTTDPSQDSKTGAIIANNHYGTRDFNLSPHAKNGLTCLTCHKVHGPNANGQLLKQDNPNDICATCHGSGKVDYKKVMFDNPSDKYGHTTADHSFGAVPLSAMTVNKDTKNMEITDPKVVETIKKHFPLFK